MPGIGQGDAVRAAPDDAQAARSAALTAAASLTRMALSQTEGLGSQRRESTMLRHHVEVPVSAVTYCGGQVGELMIDDVPDQVGVHAEVLVHDDVA